MPRTDFYLSSHDYIDSPEPRVCRCVGECIARQTKQVLCSVLIEPPLPQDTTANSESYKMLTLGLIGKKTKLKDVMIHPISVDIYAPIDISDIRDVSSLERIGSGVLHATLAEAAAASPLED